MGKTESIQLAATFKVKEALTKVGEATARETSYFALAPNGDTPVFVLRRKKAFELQALKKFLGTELEESAVKAMDLSTLMAGSICWDGDKLALTLDEGACRGTVSPRAAGLLLKAMKDVPGCAALATATVKLSTVEARTELTDEQRQKIAGVVGNQAKVATGQKKTLDKPGKKALERSEQSRKAYEGSRQSKRAEIAAELVISGGGLEVPSDAEVRVTGEPGVRGEIKKDTMLYEVHPQDGMKRSWSLTRGTTGVVRKTDDTGYVHVHVYTDADGDTKFDAAKKGFASSRDVKVLQRYAPMPGPLFPGKPSAQDVSQGNLGDCYFLAGIMAVVDKNPDLITDMMKDNGDGTVTVRLFASEGGDEAQPQYVTVPKTTLVSDDGRDEHATGAPWVEILEKAFAEVRSRSGRTAHAMLGLEGGSGGESIAALTGNRVVGRPMKSPKKQFGSLLDTTTLGIAEVRVDDGNAVAVKAALVKSGVTADGADRMIAATKDQDFTLGNDVGPVLATAGLLVMDGKTGKVPPELVVEKEGKKPTVWLGALVSAFKGAATTPDYTAVAAFAKLEAVETMRKAAGPKRDEALALLDSPAASGLSEDVRARMKRAARERLGGPRMSGEYAASDLELWDAIKKDVAADRVITVGTMDTVGSTTDGEGHSHGEKVSKGLAGKHAYALLGVYEPTPGQPFYIPPTSPTGVPIKYAVLRNPWNDQDPDRENPTAGRIYVSVRNEQGKIVAYKAQGNQRSEFLLELSDFAKRFESIGVSQPQEAPWGNVEKQRLKDAFHKLIVGVRGLDRKDKDGVTLGKRMYEKALDHGKRFGVDNALSWLTRKLDELDPPTPPEDDGPVDPSGYDGDDESE